MIVQHMLDLRDQRGEVHMKARRVGLAAQAAADGDFDQESLWMDKEKTSDEDVRQAISEA